MSKGELTTWLSTDTVRQRVGSALGGWMDPDDFLAQIMISFQDPDVKSCRVDSLFAAAHTCASLGLLPSLGQVALIPRKGVCTVMPQWQGYQAIMLRNPEVQDVTAHLVHVNDEYDLNVGGKFTHNFDAFDESRTFEDWKDLKGGYLKIQYTDGRPDKYHFVHKSHFLKAQNCAQTTKIWGAWFHQMLLKTVYRDGYARRVVPIDPLVNKRLEETVRQDDKVLGNDPSRIASPTSSVPQREPQSTAGKIMGMLGQDHAREDSERLLEGPEPESSNNDGGPDLPPELNQFRERILGTSDRAEIEEIYMEEVNTNDLLSEGAYLDGQRFYEWRLSQLG